MIKDPLLENSIIIGGALAIFWPLFKWLLHGKNKEFEEKINKKDLESNEKSTRLWAIDAINDAINMFRADIKSDFLQMDKNWRIAMDKMESRLNQNIADYRHAKADELAQLSGTVNRCLEVLALADRVEAKYIDKIRK